MRTTREQTADRRARVARGRRMLTVDEGGQLVGHAQVRTETDEARKERHAADYRRFVARMAAAEKAR